MSLYISRDNFYEPKVYLKFERIFTIFKSLIEIRKSFKVATKLEKREIRKIYFYIYIYTS